MARKEEAYEYLKQQIISGKLKAESPIAELAVAAELKMSRTPIREALRELEAEGLVVSYPARGCFVSALTPSDIEEIFALRILLERWALERSIYRIPADALDGLMELFRAAGDRGSVEARRASDRRLHEAIVDYAGSKRLSGFMASLNSQIERVRALGEADPARSDASYHENVDILARLRERDLPGCRYALSQHLKNASDACVNSVRVN